MTRDQIRVTVLRVLGTIAPELDPATLRPDRKLSDQLDLDSMDFLNFAIGLHDTLGGHPETDYPKLDADGAWTRGAQHGRRGLENRTGVRRKGETLMSGLRWAFLGFLPSVCYACARVARSLSALIVVALLLATNSWARVPFGGSTTSEGGIAAARHTEFLCLADTRRPQTGLQPRLGFPERRPSAISHPLARLAGRGWHRRTVSRPPVLRRRCPPPRSAGGESDVPG
jgi:hypothetical protein